MTRGALLLFIAACSGAPDRNAELFVQMWTPMCYGDPACGWAAGQSMDVAVKMITEHINNGSYIRGGRKLRVEVLDDECSGSRGRDIGTGMLLLPPAERAFGIIGCGCSGCTMASQPLLNIAKIPMISHTATNPALSVRTTYPNFFRLIPTDAAAVQAWFAIMNSFNWKTYAQVSEPEYGFALVDYANTVKDSFGMVDVLAGKGLSEMRDKTPQSAQGVVDVIEPSGVKIIMFLGYETYLRYLVCELAKREMFDTTFFFIGWLTPGWWLDALDKIDCAAEDMAKMINKSLSANYPEWGEKGAGAECLLPGTTVQAFADEYAKRVSAMGDIVRAEASYAADTVCFMSKVFNTLLDDGHQVDDLYSMSDAMYSTYSARVQSMSMTGTSGQIAFPGGDPMQYAGGDRQANFDILHVVDSTKRALDIMGSVVRKADGSFDIIITPGKEITFKEPGYTISNPPPGMYPQCPTGTVYKYATRQCQGCEGNFVFVEAVNGCLCKAGYYKNGSSCEACHEGTMSDNPGTLQCSSCTKGFYQDERGTTTCKRCEKGSHMASEKASACVPCGKNQVTLESGADSSALCLCAEGSFMKPSAGACVACPEGLECPAGLGEPLQLPGFFAEVIDKEARDYRVWSCRDKSECSSQAVGSCPGGRQGRACNNCMDGYKPLDDGSCVKCGELDAIPGIVAFVVLLLIVMCGLVFVNADLKTQTLSFLTVAMVAGQLCMVLQIFGSFRQLSVKWVEPVKSVLAVTKILSFDLDVISVTCMMVSDSPVSKFVAKLFVYPMTVVMLACAWGLSKFMKKPLDFDKVFNLNGLLLYIIFITLTLTVLLPLQCKPNPSGSTSMVSSPGLVCFESEEHATMVVLAVFGILAYPLLILAWISYTTWKYPSRVSSGHGLQMVSRYRFLFNRFKTECYYYGLVLMVRNLLISLLPVILVSAEALQLVAMGTLLQTSGFFVALLLPWRTTMANAADIAISGFLVIMMVGAAPLLEIDISASEGVVGGMLCVVTLAPVVIGLGAIGYGIFRRFMPAETFGVFLCHHKGGAGALARLLKYNLANITNAKVFLDSDQLEDLDLIFDTVRTGTKNLVILLTSEVLKRMWCSGEITTAHVNNVPIIPVICDGFVRLSDEDIAMIGDVWTEQQKNVLASYGITVESIQSAYHYIRNLPHLTLLRFEGSEKRASLVKELVDTGKLPTKLRASSGSGSARPRILVTGAVADGEALAAIEIFKLLCQQHMQVETNEVMTPEQMALAKPYASYLVVLFSRGMLQNPLFARMLLVALADKGHDSPSTRVLELVTVNADNGFEFPSVEFLTDLEKNGLGVPGLGAEVGLQLSKSYRTLLSVLALPLAPHGSAGLLSLQISEICRRFRRYKDLPQGLALDTEDDKAVGSVTIDDLKGFDNMPSNDHAPASNCITEEIQSAAF
eukprot:TRINITY_DN39160_c0_g1_i1.p1 TRINITY_DN39160_c0_g1~~TRINITY_DN39160_c0_g1_i1.p1  ORF type:complete len:1422 (+),score=258.12 TRINITY_DN39160_c0_g1_i1:115-4380(+)